MSGKPCKICASFNILPQKALNAAVLLKIKGLSAGNAGKRRQ
jgi:hypothetical protein